MRIVGARLTAVAVPYTAELGAVVTAGLRLTEARHVLIELVTDDGRVGLGEAVPRPSVYGETLEGQIAALSGLMGLAAADTKTETIKGKGECAKCSLKETTKCQNAIKTADGKTYYLADNKVSKDFHEEVCKETKKVTATGTVKEVDGKMQLTASKIDLAK